MCECECPCESPRDEAPQAAPAPHHEPMETQCPSASRQCQRTFKKCGSAPTELATTAFRIEEKRYKLYKPDKRAPKKNRIEETDFSDVVDFHCLEQNTEANKSMMHRVDNAGIECYTFSGVPGLLIFPNCVSEDRQRYWVKSALTRFSNSKSFPNNITTLDPTAVTDVYAPPMRWATLGFKYDWTERTYDKARYVLFPSDLNAFMCKLVSHVAEVTQDEFAVLGNYQSQTAIVNYFPVGSMMMAHQDISEVCLQKPLMSMSLGCSCIFLMGTENRDDKPFAFLLKSGDVAAFTGPSRTAFHAIPRILDDCPQHFFGAGDDDTEDSSWKESMKGLRVNINVRQVYDEQCDFLFNEGV